MKEGLTQAGLAHRLDVTPGVISRWEGGSAPTGANRLKLMEVLGLSSKASVKPDKGQHNSTSISTGNEVSSFGAWLRTQRESAGLSVFQLGEKSKVSLPAIYNIESGRIQNPQSSTRDKLAKALEQVVPQDVILETEKDQKIVGLGDLTDFGPHDKKAWPTCSGVYVLYDVSQRPVYVGKAKNISSRLSSHNNYFWYKDPIVRFGSYVKVEDEQLRHQLEQAMIKFLKNNAVINKQSSEQFFDTD